MKQRELNIITRKENAESLSNTIIMSMMDKRMTLENLDDAVEIVTEAYRKNAALRD